MSSRMAWVAALALLAGCGNAGQNNAKTSASTAGTTTTTGGTANPKTTTGSTTPGSTATGTGTTGTGTTGTGTTGTGTTGTGTTGTGTTGTGTTPRPSPVPVQPAPHASPSPAPSTAPAPSPTPTPSTAPAPSPTPTPAPSSSPGTGPNAALANAVAASPTLKLTSTGTNVANLQDALRAVGFDPGATDGSFGPNTQVAVVAFQEAKGLAADGIVGPMTRGALVTDLNNGTVLPSYQGTYVAGGLFTGAWQETNAASGQTMGSGSGGLRMILVQDVSGNLYGAVKLTGTAGGTVVYQLNSGTCDANGNFSFYCDDRVSTGSPSAITTLQFVGSIQLGSPDSASGSYYVTGSAFPGNAGSFSISR